MQDEVDAASKTHLKTVADDAVAVGRPVVVDVTAVTFMDSTGAAFIATLVRGLGADHVTVLHPSELVHFPLTVTKLGPLIHIVATRQ